MKSSVLVRFSWCLSLLLSICLLCLVLSQCRNAPTRTYTHTHTHTHLHSQTHLFCFYFHATFALLLTLSPLLLEKVAIVAHVPAELQEIVKLEDWLNSILTPTGGEILEKTDTTAKAVIKGDSAAGRYPIKLRELGINSSFAFLKSKNLITEDSDDDEYVNYAEVRDHQLKIICVCVCVCVCSCNCECVYVCVWLLL